MSRATTGAQRLAVPRRLDPGLRDIACSPMITDALLRAGIGSVKRLAAELAAAKAETDSLRTSLARQQAAELAAAKAEADSLRTLLARQQHALAEAQRKEASMRDAMADAEDRIDRALADLLASRSWRVARSLRRVLGIEDTLVAPDDRGSKRLVEKLQLCLAVSGSVWWDLAMPLRILSRSRHLLLQIMDRR